MCHPSKIDRNRRFLWTKDSSDKVVEKNRCSGVIRDAQIQGLDLKAGPSLTEEAKIHRLYKGSGSFVLEYLAVDSLAASDLTSSRDIAGHRD